MKSLLCTLVMLAGLPWLKAVAAGPTGYLVFEISRYPYTMGSVRHSELKQSFKIPLTAEFLANFKNAPSLRSSGTGFCCSGGDLKNGPGSTHFMWWIRRTADHRWAINMWGEGVEALNGRKVSSHDPTVSQDLTIKNWADLDMRYMLSYVNEPNGINVSFSAKYVPAADLKALGPIPDAPVQKADQSVLFKGDDLKDVPLTLNCGFQEG